MFVHYLATLQQNLAFHALSTRNAEFLACFAIQIENLVLQHEEYGNFCELNYTGADPKCIDQLSPLPFFYEYNASARQFGDFRQSLEDALDEMRQVL